MANMNAKQRLLDTLFAQGGPKLLDLKFCRGYGDVVSEEEFAGEVLKARAQHAAGRSLVSDRFEEHLSLVEVTELVMHR